MKEVCYVVNGVSLDIKKWNDILIIEKGATDMTVTWYLMNQKMIA